MARRKPPDWAAIEAECLAGATYKELARRHRVSERTVERRGSAGNWKDRCRDVVGLVSGGLPAAVAGAITERAANDAVMGREEVLERLTAAARGGMRRVAKWGPEGVALTKSDDLTDDERWLVTEVSETPTKYGKRISIKVIDQLAATKELARYHGLSGDEHRAKPLGGGGSPGSQPHGVLELPMLDAPPVHPDDEVPVDDGPGDDDE